MIHPELIQWTNDELWRTMIAIYDSKVIGLIGVSASG